MERVLPFRFAKSQEHKVETQPSVPWHSWDLQKIYKELATTESGLDSAEAERRLGEYGFNRLPEQPPVPLWAIILRQFRSPLIYILLLAAVVSLFLGDLKDATFIGIVLILNAVIGAYQEWKAEKSSSALKELLKLHAVVERDQETTEVDAECLVPGDVVLIESGNRVPADLRLVWAKGLEIDESLLTGESVAINKEPRTDLGESVSTADQVNMAFAGSLVARGRGRGVVVATGSGTQVGNLARDVVSGEAGKAPLIERMERFSKTVAIVTVLAAAFIGVIGVTMDRYEPSEMFMVCIALIVSAIPEGLPVAMTVALAVATTKMAKRGAIVRRLTAVEGLGSCTLIATDKTGTLTCNALTVQVVELPNEGFLEVTGEGFSPEGGVVADGGKPVDAELSQELKDLARAALLCNEGDLHQSGAQQWVWRGDAVDVALLSLGIKLGMSRREELKEFPLVGQIPFESELQFAATFHRVDKATYVFVKGSPERVLSMCMPQSSQDQVAEMEGRAVNLASKGFRVIALADGQVEEAIAQNSRPDEINNLRFLGFLGMQDPLRPGASDAISECEKAGINVTMITGDHRVTALAIARQLGLADDEKQVITGDELSEVSDERLSDTVSKTRVFARVAPHQKLKIVKAAQRSDEFVAVTGDGVNDAPALRAANIGVAMGQTGTDVAREAADLVIKDDDFATIVAGIEEGRVAYDNIRKVIFLLVSAGAAEVALVLLSVIAGLPLPLLAVQLLWLNLVTNGVQGVALAFEPNEGDVLQRRPRPPNQEVFDRLMLERMLVSVAVMGGIGFATFYFLTTNLGWGVADARNSLLLLMVLFENIHIGNCRSETKSAFVLSPLRSPFLMIGALSAFALHLLAMMLPWGHEFLGTRPVTLREGMTIFGLALTILPAMEIHKWLWNKRMSRTKLAGAKL